MDQWSKTTSHFKTGLGFHATRRTSFLLWFQACQVRLQGSSSTPSRQESHCSPYSSSSSSSPAVSEIQTRERGDRIESDISPMHVSTSVDDRSGQPDETTIERGNPLSSEIPEWLQEFRENLVDDRVPEHRDSHASSSHEASLEPIFKRSEDLGKNSVFFSFA